MSHGSLERQRQRVTLIGIGLLVLGFTILYGMTKARGPVGFGDSDELIGIGWLLGLPHAPGYPFLTALVYLISRLTFGRTVADTAHWLSVGFQIMTLIGVYGVGRQLLAEAFPRRTERERAVIAALSSVWLGLSYSFWLSANYLEVFPLHNLLTVVMIWATLRSRWMVHSGSKISRRFIIGYGVSLVLLFGHQQLSILLLPGMICWWWPIWKRARRKTRKTVIRSLLASMVIAGLILILTIWGLGQRDVWWHWQLSEGSIGLVRYVLRQPFTGLMIESGEILNAWNKGFQAELSFQTLWFYVTRAMPNQFSTILGGFALIGMVSGWYRLQRNTFWGLALNTILTGPLLVAYMALPYPHSGPDLKQVLAITERFWGWGWVNLSLWLPLGLAGLTGVIWPRHNRVNNRAVLIGTSIIGVGIAVWLFGTNFARVDLSQPNKAYQQLWVGLETIPAGSTIICGSDISCFGIGYLIATGEVSHQVKVVPITPQMKMGAQANGTEHFFYPDNPFRILEAVAQAYAAGENVYVLELPTLYQGLAGLDGQAFWLAPSSLGLHIVCEEEGKDNYPTGPKVTEQTISWERPLFQQWQEDLEGHNWNLQVFASPRREEQPCLTADEHLELAQACRLKNMPECEYLQTLWGSIKDPGNMAIRWHLAKLYEEQGFLSLAQREYQRVLLLDPANASAAAKVRTLPQLTEEFN